MSENDNNPFGRLEVAVKTLRSPVAGGRKENQDNYLLIDGRGRARFLRDQHEQQEQKNDWPSGHVRLAVLDGMGGHADGRQVAEQAAQGILRIPATTNIGSLSDALERLHRTLHQALHRDGAEPGCTLTLLEIPEYGPALLFHVGDSRLYAIDNQRATVLTVDHVPVTRYALLRMIDQEEWYRQVHEHSSSQISQAFVLGNSLNFKSRREQLEPGLFELHDGNLPDFLRGKGDRRTLDLQSGYTYLLSSDGLWHLRQPRPFVRRWPELLTRPELPLAEQLDRTFDELCRRIAEEPNNRGDNTTVIAFRTMR